MLETIYREFEIRSVPFLEQVVEHGRERTRLSSDLTITHRKTKEQRKVTNPFAVSDNYIERVVYTQFPKSDSARALRSIYGLDKVVLKKDYAEFIGESLHTALRKLCDSPGSAYWWNMIHLLPRPIFSVLCDRSVKAFGFVGNSAPLYKYAEALKDAWVDVLDEAVQIGRDNAFGGIEKQYIEAGWDNEIFKDMRSKERENFNDTAKMARLSIEYLSDEDWRGMMGYMIDYQAESVEAA